MQDEGGCWTEKKDGETRTHACAFVRACRRERRWIKGEREGWMDGENLFRFVETRLSVLIVPLFLSLFSDAIKKIRYSADRGSKFGGSEVSCL